MVHIKKNNRILIVYDVAYPFVHGGGQKRLWEVSQRLLKNNFSIEWICFKTWKGNDTITKDGIKFIGLNGFKGLYNKNGKRRKLEPLEFIFHLHKSKIDYKKYNIIWSGQWPFLHLFYWLFLPNIKLKKVVIDWWEIWGTTWFNYSKIIGWTGYFLEKILIKIYAKFSNIVVISQRSMDKALDATSSKNIKLIHNGINFKNEINVFEKRFDFVYLGRLIKHKKVDKMIDAINLINKTKPDTKINSLIIGNGPEYKNLIYQINLFGLSDQITIMKNVNTDDEVNRLLLSSKVFINPSIKEGGGSITLFEAYSMGLPAIFFRCKDGIDPILIEKNNTGILVERVETEDLAKSMLSILEDERKLKKMSQNARFFVSNFDWSIISDEYRDLFEIIDGT